MDSIGYPFVAEQLVLYESLLTTGGPRYESAPDARLRALMGCLSAPFKLLGGVALIVALAIGWLYRDRLGTELHRVFGPPAAGEPADRAWPAGHTGVGIGAVEDRLAQRVAGRFGRPHAIGGRLA